MPIKFIKTGGNWTDFRKLPGRMMEVDLHFGEGASGNFWDSMDRVEQIVRGALKNAQNEGFDWVMFRHGWSTSRPGSTSSRSVVRGLMRSRDSSPFIVKNKSYQHQSVFVAAIKSSARSEEKT